MNSNAEAHGAGPGQGEHGTAGSEAKGNPVPDRHWIYLLAILTIGYVLNFVDRQVINILAEPIKRDLGLQDWQLGAMSGLSFALVYGAMALPIARVAERVNRVRLITTALVVWSGSTLLCGAAQNFGQLAAARVAVGIGESGYTPSAHSLITQSVPKTRRTFAFAVFGTGLPLGSMIALGFGGLVADIWGWRAAFLLAGLPGFIIAAVIFFTVRDPRVQQTDVQPRVPSSFLGDARVLLGKRALLLFITASGLLALGGYGIQAFIASFLMRLHAGQLAVLASRIQQSWGIDLGPTAIIGPALGLVVGLAGVSSALVSGLVTDRLVARDARNFSRVAGIPMLLCVPALIAALLSPSIGGALGFMALFQILAGLAGPAITSCIQTLAPSSMRATASALTLLALVLFGNGLGPFAVGLMSDLIRAAGYDQGYALRFAMIGASLPLLASATLFLSAGRHLRRNLDDPGDHE